MSRSQVIIQGMSVKYFAKKIDDLTLYGQNRVRFNAQGWFDTETKYLPGNYANYTIFSTQKVKCPRRFLEIDYDCAHTCFMSPCQAVVECVCVFFCCFLAGISRSPKTQMSFGKYQKKNVGKQTIVHGLAGVHRTREQNFRLLSPENVVTVGF